MPSPSAEPSISERQAQRILHQLHEEGLTTREGPNKAGRGIASENDFDVLRETSHQMTTIASSSKKESAPDMNRLADASDSTSGEQPSSGDIGRSQTDQPVCARHAVDTMYAQCRAISSYAHNAREFFDSSRLSFLS